MADDEQMERLRLFFPASQGKPRINERRVLSGIFFFNHNGLRWRDAPKDYGPARAPLRHSRPLSRVEIAKPVRVSGETSPGLDRQGRIGADLVRYAVSREAGGSGGDTVTMHAERSSKAGVLVLEWHGQPEAGTEPDFAEAWVLFGAVGCEA